MLYKLAVLLPLLSFVILGAIHLIKPSSSKAQQRLPIVATVLLGISFLLSVFGMFDTFGSPNKAYSLNLFNWIDVANLNVSFGLLIDRLSVLMLFVVSLISFMVHLYSIEYMKHDEHKVRFFSYLGLFTFVMFLLVTAPNLLQLFLGWEGVGVASYLLIGFWYKKDSASAASIKAFIVNRVADLALIGAMILIFVETKTLDISVILENAEGLSNLNIIALLLFIGAMGKSAQFGFHTWLPDAMEGPTPVSALIHSATMVSAGVFLVARMSGLFELSDILPIIAIVGMVTAIFASLVGLAQKDIKRVIAYSTCAQLGYMFFACGISAYSVAMFHLFTHAFFKALLFLGAGSVIHGCKDEQNMFKMGGLKKAMPYTFALMWIGSLALLGVPPFAGYFSKDFILEAAFMSGTDIGYWVYAVGTFGAMLTAIYSCRVIFLVFNAESKLPKETHAHESNLIMLIPMVILAIGAVFAGFLGTAMTQTDFWQGAITIIHSTGVENAHHTPVFFKYLPLALVIIGIIIADKIILGKKCQTLLVKAMPIHKIFENKFYIDELYSHILVKPFVLKTKAAVLFDKMVDSVVNAIAVSTIYTTQRLKKMQTGYVADYNMAFLLVVIVALAGIILTFILGA